MIRFLIHYHGFSKVRLSVQTQIVLIRATWTACPLPNLAWQENLMRKQNPSPQGKAVNVTRREEWSPRLLRGNLRDPALEKWHLGTSCWASVVWCGGIPLTEFNQKEIKFPLCSLIGNKHVSASIAESKERSACNDIHYSIGRYLPRVLPRRRWLNMNWMVTLYMYYRGNLTQSTLHALIADLAIGSLLETYSHLYLPS